MQNLSCYSYVFGKGQYSNCRKEINSIKSEDKNTMINILNEYIKEKFKLYPKLIDLPYGDDDTSIKKDDSNPNYPGSGDGRFYVILKRLIVSRFFSGSLFRSCFTFIPGFSSFYII